jgi:hypothetical protein
VALENSLNQDGGTKGDFKEYFLGTNTEKGNGDHIEQGNNSWSSGSDTKNKNNIDEDKNDQVTKRNWNQDSITSNRRESFKNKESRERICFKNDSGCWNKNNEQNNHQFGNASRANKVEFGKRSFERGREGHKFNRGGLEGGFNNFNNKGGGREQNRRNFRARCRRGEGGVRRGSGGSGGSSLRGAEPGSGGKWSENRRNKGGVQSRVEERCIDFKFSDTAWNRWPASGQSNEWSDNATDVSGCGNSWKWSSFPVVSDQQDERKGASRDWSFKTSNTVTSMPDVVLSYTHNANDFD